MTLHRPQTPLTLPDRTTIERAAARVAEVCCNPPLVQARPSRNAPRRAHQTSSIWLKPETLQPIGSFKLRGVFAAVSSMSDEERNRGLLTVSAGNTAQALAWCGRYFGVPATSLMPEGAPQTKIDAVRALGGETRMVPTSQLFEFLRCRGWEQESESFVHPWIDRRVIAGHASLGLEIVAAMNRLAPRASRGPVAVQSAGSGSSSRRSFGDAPHARRPFEDAEDADGAPRNYEIFVSVGGGGLIAGVAAALRAREMGARVRLIAVEPLGCPALHEALRHAHPVEVACETFCDGVAVPYITEEMFPLLQEAVHEVVLVSEEHTRAALRQLAFCDRLIVEGSAALTYAAALQSRSEVEKVCVLSGGSIDREKLLDILAQP